MNGIIFINPYLLPRESVKQAECLKKKFADLDVDTQVVSNGYLYTKIDNGQLMTKYSCDFAVFLDKDKYLSKALTDCGIRLFNSHKAVRLCDDKVETYLALSNKGFNLPKTIFGALCYDINAPTPKEVRPKIISELGLPMIIKESFGSMGKGVYLASTEKEFEEIAEKVKCKPHLFQRYLGKRKGVDVRVIVIGGKAIGAMERYNDTDFRSNVAIGGKCRKINAGKDFLKVAEKVAMCLGLDYCGVDILYGDNEEPYICEVNSNAFFFGFTETTGIDVAKIYAEYIVDKVRNGK